MIKYLVEIEVPIIEEKYEIFLPAHKTIESVIVLIIDGIKDLTDNSYQPFLYTRLYDKKTCQSYDLKKIINETSIRNGSELILF